MRTMLWGAIRMAFVCGTLLFGAGCAMVRRAAMNQVADIMAGDSAGGVFAEDDDPELVRDALPFALKTYELLLAENPRHAGLNLATGRAFVQYAGGFVDPEAARLQNEDYDRSRALRDRAGRLYRRGRDYALAGLELKHPGWGERLRADPEAARAETGATDVPFLFWAAVGWGGLIATDPSDMARVAELPAVEAMMRRVLELNETYEAGAAHEFLVLLEGARGEMAGGSAGLVREHFERAVALSGGRRASVFVAMASTAAVKQQDARLFRDLLGRALAVDPEAVPEWRLVNHLARRQARWLLREGPNLFLEYEEQPPGPASGSSSKELIGEKKDDG